MLSTFRCFTAEFEEFGVFCCLFEFEDLLRSLGRECAEQCLLCPGGLLVKTCMDVGGEPGFIFVWTCCHMRALQRMLLFLQRKHGLLQREQLPVQIIAFAAA